MNHWNIVTTDGAVLISFFCFHIPVNCCDISIGSNSNVRSVKLVQDVKTPLIKIIDEAKLYNILKS